MSYEQKKRLLDLKSAIFIALLLISFAMSNYAYMKMGDELTSRWDNNNVSSSTYLTDADAFYALREIINYEREKRGMNRTNIEMCIYLMRGAKIWASDLMRRKAFEHAPDEEICKGMPQTATCGEVIGIVTEEAGHPTPESFAYVAYLWFNSPEHRAILLMPWSYMGVGSSCNSTHCIFVARFSDMCGGG